MGLLVAAGLAGCDLYFGHAQAPVDAVETEPPRPDAPSQPPPVTCSPWWLCRDGVVYEAPSAMFHQDVCLRPDFSTATEVETCQYGCTASAETPIEANAPLPCGLPLPSNNLDCNASGTCTQGDTQQCGGPLACRFVASTGTCTCDGGTWSCVPACSDGLCSAEAVQQALVGTWTGTVTPPSFAPPYDVTLTIAPDGSWIGSTSESYRVVFYYGDDGGNPTERILVTAQTSGGAYATVGLFGGNIQGLIEAIHVDPHHLTFTFDEAWLDCGRPFAFDLQR